MIPRMPTRAILLGPQRHVPMVRPAVEALVGPAPGGRIALVTAGWEEREAEDQELRDHLGMPSVNLAVWSRVETIFTEDPELLGAMRERHDTLRRAQEIYRLRLGGLVSAALELLRRGGDEELLDPARDGAVAMLQALDRQHEEQVADLHAAFEARIRPAERESVVRHRAELARLVAEAPCTCIAGGHVGVLLHRLRLFGFDTLVAQQPFVAWSAGAMVASERIVLFHDDPPQGAADPEVMERGLALVQGLVALPHASRRLQLGDSRRIALLARRFAPDRCAALDAGTRMDWDGTRWSAPVATSVLRVDGQLVGAAT
ncbi:MAG: hypothetical protein RL148_2738 [Planctomycetota bacterium]